MPALDSTELFKLINWLCVFETHFPSETQGLKDDQNLCARVGWIVSSHKKSHNLLVTKYFRYHTYQCCTCSSAISKTILNINFFFSAKLHNSLLHQVNLKKKISPARVSTENLQIFCKLHIISLHTWGEQKQELQGKGFISACTVYRPSKRTQLSKISLLWKLSVIFVFKQKDPWNLGVCLIMENI